MLETYRVSDLDQLRLLADPLKLRIIQAFAAGPRTTSQVAESLGENLTRLYRHVDALLAAGLIEVVGEKKKRGTVERSFKAVARRFEVDHALFTRDDALAATARDILRAGEEELLGALAAASADHEPPLAMRLHMQGSPERIRSLRRALEDWLESAQEADASDGDLPADSVEAGALIAFYVLPPARSRK